MQIALMTNFIVIKVDVNNDSEQLERMSLRSWKSQ